MEPRKTLIDTSIQRMGGRDDTQQNRSQMQVPRVKEFHKSLSKRKTFYRPLTWASWGAGA